MMLLDGLKQNNGTVSSKLGKELAEEVLSGNDTILHEAIELITYELQSEKGKKVRSGAAKITEKVYPY